MSTETTERTINKKRIRKVLVRGKLYPVIEGSANHTDEGVEVEYKTNRGTNTTFVKRGEFTKKLRHW